VAATRFDLVSDSDLEAPLLVGGTKT